MGMEILGGRTSFLVVRWFILRWNNTAASRAIYFYTNSFSLPFHALDICNLFITIIFRYRSYSSRRQIFIPKTNDTPFPSGCFARNYFTSSVVARTLVNCRRVHYPVVYYVVVLRVVVF
jgi:hypothetical protein